MKLRKELKVDLGGMESGDESDQKYIVCMELSRDKSYFMKICQIS